MKRVELLAPAGNYESFLGAIRAGADAVYIGGEKFGARAYAQNFSAEEIVNAVRYAHLFRRKVYLTVNTLMKEAEMEELRAYLLPLYECGLDAVIVQDLGVVRMVRECFPNLQLHSSTQMTVTGVYGAKLMKRWGASRVVAARELSLEEIRAIKDETGMEVEAFVHGALCYCYSGQCLFSSVLGGRSGNRGRCAQPCRLPYQGDSLYPLSLKDLCTVEMIPRLIEAGVDSFKIEGRMKKPEYAAGVTHIYRKYIDRYENAPEAPFAVEAKDLDFLRQLYVRSDLESGYYDRHNGREMITLQKPSYAGSDQAVLADIRSRFLEQPKCLGIGGRLVVKPEHPVSLTLFSEAGEELLRMEGDLAQQAQRQPLDQQSLRRQINKTGHTPFVFKKLDIALEGNAFLPLKAVNELRRQALEQLYEKLSPRPDRTALEESCPAENRRADALPELFVSVRSLEQFFAVLDTAQADGIYLPLDCLLGADAAQREKAAQEALAHYRESHPGFVCYLCLPYIIRRRDAAYLEAAERLLRRPFVDGTLCSSLECYEWVAEKQIDKPLLTDANLYCFNRRAAAWLREDAYPQGQAAVPGRTLCLTLPLEADRKQLRALAAADTQLIVYGRTNMMVSANCVRKTLGHCLLETKGDWREAAAACFALKDRFHTVFPVDTDCLHCTNLIYNSLPTSLHRELDQIKTWGVGSVRLRFTVETAGQAAQITAYFAQLLRTDAGTDLQPPFKEFTKGHFKNGVE